MSQKKYIKLPIKGMHCRSCELLIEDSLKGVDHVQSADISYQAGEAIINYEGTAPDMESLKKCIADAGYEIGVEGRLPFFSREKKEYTNLGVAFLFLMIFYFVLRGLGVTNINLTPSLSSPSWGVVVLVGLVAGISTCMALVGGLSLGLSARFAASHPQATAAEKFQPHIFFIIGRILTYALLGGFLGVLGTVLQFSAKANGTLTIIVGLVMLIMGLQLINIFPRISRFKLTLPTGIAKALNINQKKKDNTYTHQRAMLLGGLTFFLPCGFTQAMQLYAISTGSFAYGALTMGLFALGTAPGLLSVGGVSSLVRGSYKEKFFKAAGLAVIFFALFNLSNGYTLAGFSLDNFSSGKKYQSNISDPNVVMEDGVQVVSMTEVNEGYSPNQFAIQKGVPVRWEIDAQAPYSCASSLVVPKLNIQETLRKGKNIIEFTPEEVGRISFSCSMGMYTGSFTVYDSDSIDSGSSANRPTASTVPAASAGGSTCGVGGSGSGGGCGCGGGGPVNPVDTGAAPVTATKIANSDIQLIKTVYTKAKYLSPAAFKVKAGSKVRLEIDVRDNGVGCGYSIMIPELYNQDTPLRAGTPIVMEFTPTKPGTYDITCGMDMIRFGSIIVE